MKIRSKGVVNVSRDLLLEFWDHSISWERLKPCTVLQIWHTDCSHLVYTKQMKIRSKAGGRGYVNYF